MVKVVVEVQGGLVTSVTTDGPGVEVYVADRDLEGRSEPGDWPGGEEVKAVGGLQDLQVDPARVSTLMGEIAAECDYCEGTGKGDLDPGDGGPPTGRCPECEGRGWWLPYAEPAGPSPDLGCTCGLADLGAPGHEEQSAPSALQVPAVEFGEDVQHQEQAAKVGPDGTESCAKGAGG
jgi:hypothetical protein